MKRFFNDDDEQNFFEEETDDYDSEIPQELTAFISGGEFVSPIELLHAQFECDLFLRAVDLAKESTLFWSWRSEKYQIKRIDFYYKAMQKIVNAIDLKGDEDASV